MMFDFLQIVAGGVGIAVAILFDTDDYWMRESNYILVLERW